MNEKDLTPEDLAADETFIAWFMKSDAYHVQYWDTWIREHPAAIDVVARARQLLEELVGKGDPVSDAHTLQARDRLRSALNQQRTVIPSWSRLRIRQWAAAAAIAGLLLLSVPFLLSKTRVEVRTDFAETRSVVLPDGSQVTLNANSRLNWKRDWGKGSQREVWLEGEGFFSVRHTVDNSRFIVHSQDINVEVLGTEFNLQQRRNKTTVVLHTGKVRLTEVNTGENKPVIMAPGDLVEYDGPSHKLSRKVVETEIYSAWKEGKMSFVNADFKEITEVLEENYGLKVVMKDLRLSGQQFNGVYPTNNLQVLLAALSKTYDLEIQLNDREIIFRTKK
ncbi:FecR family protein [Flavihumibacter petaseus]|uniref:Putative anti-sigma factor n=1 Tax=Flavihumibacter petaseus NBRC 106054 TaxID=1220578 RepID=A0A0E9MVB5_9BACT|nr:FecR domain-containing protein [Flavihumibacter petaseus]GAO41519.1 putative anti-sigma factor [Flavihumibacter petaseus NBRC 106054]